MRYYHGTKCKGLKCLESLDVLRMKGLCPSGSTDAYRDNFTDAVFVTSDRDVALQYAGLDGVVYEVMPINPVLYSIAFEERMLSGAFTGKSRCLLKKKLKKLKKCRNSHSNYICDYASIL